jgi:hypothetical protein
MLNKVKLVMHIRKQNYTVFSISDGSGMVCLLPERVWHSACNETCRVQQIIVFIYFLAFNQIRVGQTRVEGELKHQT